MSEKKKEQKNLDFFAQNDKTEAQTEEAVEVDSIQPEKEGYKKSKARRIIIKAKITDD